MHAKASSRATEETAVPASERRQIPEFPEREAARADRGTRGIKLAKRDRLTLAREIEEADGSEILSAATIEPDGAWGSFRILARGTSDEAPAILRGLRPGDILLHNHPNGLLQPSNADLNVASICGRSGIGFAIHDNACKRMYVVVEPFFEEKPAPLDEKDLRAILEQGGPLSRQLSGYEERAGQIDLLTNVVQAFNRPCHAILEGETGVGKSMAYLIPAVALAKAHKCRVAISTNTINLQYQLCNKDLPLLAKVLPYEFSFCLVKGRGNYLCVRRLDEIENATDGEMLLEAAELEEFNRIRAWAGKTKEGSLSDLSWVPTNALWEKVCSEKDTCLGLRCGHYRQCYFYAARRKAAEADILVVNHHLLFADLALRSATEEYNQTAVLPAYRAAILDEAHNLEEIATSHFGYRTTGFGLQRQLGRLFHRRGRREGGVLSSLMTRMQLDRSPVQGKTLDRLLADIQEKIIPLREEAVEIGRTLFEGITRFTLGDKEPRPGEHRLRISARQRRDPLFGDLVYTANQLHDKLQDLGRRVGKLSRELDALLDESEDDSKKLLEMPLAELTGFISRFAEVRTGLSLFFGDAPSASAPVLQAVEAEDGEFSEAADSSEFIHFFSVLVRGSARWASIHSAPLEVSKPMLNHVFNRVPSVVLVSATLSTRRNFSFIKNRLGLDHEEIEPKPIEGRFPSPFEYDEQALLLVPTDLPEPANPEFVDATVEPVFEIAQSSRGGTLVLCTSYSHLMRLYDRLAPRFAEAGLECLKQGDLERHHLLSSFQEDGNAVLFATDSFWEGVDIPGNALRNLVITKLPFVVPNDPILVARQELLEREGKNPFGEYQLPMAAIRLKQGFGRLIRNRNDRGTVWILDRRLITKFYGRFFLESLPPARVVEGRFRTILPKARAFFTEGGYR